METLKKATINETAIKNFREQSRRAAAKERVVHAALNDAACQVVRVYGPNISLDASHDTLMEIRPEVFSGKVEAQLSVDTAAGLKRIAYPIEVRASVAVLRDDIQAKAFVEGELNKTAGALDNKIAEYERNFDKNILQHTAELDEQKKVAELMESEDLTLKEAQMKMFNQKTAAAEQPLCSIPGPGASAGPNIGINALPQAFIRINKHMLPTYNVGDSLDLNGTPYVCIKSGDEFIEFQLQVL